MLSLTSHMYWVLNEISPQWGSSEFPCYTVSTKDTRVESENWLGGVFLVFYLKNSLDYIHDYLVHPARIANYWLHRYTSEEITNQWSSVWNTLKHRGFVGMNTAWMGTLHVCLRVCVETTVFFLALFISNCLNWPRWLLFKLLIFLFIGFLFKSTNDFITDNNP